MRELVLLIDAIPPEYREEVLVAALRLGTNVAFQESYLVASVRDQLRDCLMEKTGTIHDFTTLRQHDRSAIRRCLAMLAVAEDPVQVATVFRTLLDLLIDVL